MGLDAYINKVDTVYLKINLKTREVTTERDFKDIAYFRKFVPLHIWFIRKLNIEKERFYSGDKAIPKKVVSTLIKDIKISLTDKRKMQKLFPQTLRTGHLGLSSFYTQYEDRKSVV